MDWDNISFQNFLLSLQKYKDKFYLGNPSEEKYYLEIIVILENQDIKNKANYVDSIVLFLNRWHCRFSKEISPKAISDWIIKESNKLKSISNLTIDNLKLKNNIELIKELYNSLFELRSNGIHNMSDACASKILHLMIPKLFVMWDLNIMQNYEYDSFIIKMHEFSLKLINEYKNKFNNFQIEKYLQEYYNYPFKKSLAKYIDEYNWYEAFGKNR